VSKSGRSHEQSDLGGAPRRRTPLGERRIVRNYTLDEDRRLLLRDGARVQLEPRVYDLLVYLVRHRQRAVSREELTREVWEKVVLDPSAVSAAVRKLRRALMDNSERPAIIETVRGFGFRFVSDVIEDLDTDGACGTALHESVAYAARKHASWTIAVSTYDTIGGVGPELGRAIGDELLVRLHGEYGMRVLSPDESDSSASAFDAGIPDVHYQLRGYLARTSEGLHASSRLMNLVTSRIIWTAKARSDGVNVVAAIDSIASTIVAGLRTVLAE
jgi:DNA-binding winged helix-turn-helix (wHTH) protein